MYNKNILVLKLKKGKTEEETIIKIGQSKFRALKGRISLMKKKKLDSEIDIFDMATESKKQLMTKRIGKNG